MGWLVAFFFAICTGLLILTIVVLGDEYRQRAVSLKRPISIPESNPPADGDFRTDASGESRPTGPRRDAEIAPDRELTAGEPFHDSAIKPPGRGCLLAGRYRIVAIIGRGGMGIVYRAWDRRSKRYTVIKMPRPDLLLDGSLRERFRRELEIVRRLDHPAIVPVLDVGEFTSPEGSAATSTPFAVMPYLAGGSLQRRRKRRRGQPLPQSPDALRDWLPDVAAALDHVHAQGLLHRDIKPANVLFDGLGCPYLGDFGVAKALRAPDESAAELTQTGFALGTPAYMAPEFVVGTAIDARADQYSLAVMVFEFVAGRPPFTAATPAATLMRQVSEPAPRLDCIRHDLPPALVDAVDRGLRKSRDERFGSCRTFADAVLVDVRSPRRPKQPKLMCPDCGKLLTTHRKWAGRSGRCPNCRVQLEIGDDLSSLWLRRDRDHDEPPRRNGHRLTLPRQLDWINRNGLFMTVLFTTILALTAAIVWGFTAVVLAALTAAALFAWWFVTRVFRAGKAPPAERPGATRTAAEPRRSPGA